MKSVITNILVFKSIRIILLSVILSILATGGIVLLMAQQKNNPEGTVFFKTYVREKGKPRVVEDNFSVGNPGNDFLLLVQNGENGENRVSSAIISINGEEVVTPDDFNQQVDHIEKYVTLKKENVIAVEVRGKPGSFIIVYIIPTVVNNPPEITSIPVTEATEDVLYTYDVKAIDPDPEDKLTYSLTTSPTGMNINAETGLIQWTPTASQFGTHEVTVQVDDGQGGTDTQSFTLAVDNHRPVADAGPDQTVFVGQTVTLDGSGSSDVDGDTLTFSWSFDITTMPEGSTATLSDPTAVKPTFVVDKPGVYAVQLMVNDGTVESEVDTVSISTENSPPVANAGSDQTVFVGQTVTLDGSGSSDVDGDTLTFSWSFVSKPENSATTLSEATAVKPTFVADWPGSYVVQLIVNDGAVDSEPDTMTVVTENSPPIADAGLDQTVFVGDTVTLDGSGSSDVDSDYLTFKWSFVSTPENSSATLSVPTAVNPTFWIDLPGIYVAQLIVNDGTVDSAPDTVTITTQNSKPVADAGEAQTVLLGDTVTFDGSASADADKDPLTYQWSLIVLPTGSNASLSDPTAISPSFVPDVAGLYVAQLIVNDGTVDSDPDTVTITAETRKITVPNVVNMTQDDAQTVIVAFKLTVGTTSISHNTKVLEGRVISQYPTAGTTVDEGSTVDFEVSLGPAQLTVPDVVGLPQVDAETAIIQTLLTVGKITTANSATVPAGHVISQEPVGGTRVPQGSAVDLVISLGPVNEAPVAVDDTYSVDTGDTLFVPVPGVLTNDTDPEGSALTAALVDDFSEGILKLNPDGSFEYTPGVGPNRSVSFTYRANDGVNPSNIAYVTIDLMGVDLVTECVDISGMTTDTQTLEVSGTVRVDIHNNSTRDFTGSFTLLAYEDINGNAIFDGGIDNVLGTMTFSGSIGSGAITPVDVPVSGAMLFRDNLVYVHSGKVTQSGQCSTYQPPVGDYGPMVEWQWDDDNSAGVMLHSPTVAPLIDTNGDAVIDAHDIPAVVVATYGTPSAGEKSKLVALRGDTGEEIFSVLCPNSVGWSHRGHTPTVGDIDNDGRPEILLDDFGNTLYAYNNDGTVKWSLDNPLLNTNNGHVALADLDGDGWSEILHGSDAYRVIIINADGTPRLPTTNPPIVQSEANYGGPMAADLNLDGTSEIIAGPSAWDKDGNFLWGWSTIKQLPITKTVLIGGYLDGNTKTPAVEFESPDYMNSSWTAVANLDDDPYPEIISVNAGNEGGTLAGTNAAMWIFEHDGRIHSGPFGLFRGTPGVTAYELGPPTVADFDGDGKPEIAISARKQQYIDNNTFDDPSRTIMTVYRPDGSVVWQRDDFIGWSGGGSFPSSAFDFDGDGASELVFLDTQKLYILNGRDGTTLFEIGIDALVGNYFSRYPTIADVDNDGSAEIIVPTSKFGGLQAGSPPRRGVLVLGDSKGNWDHARRVWNQWQYNVTNINEDGSIPPVARNSWEVTNSHRQQIPVEELDPSAAPDLSVSKIVLDKGDYTSGAVNIIARIGNGGNRHVGPRIPVNFYDGDPGAGGTLLGTQKTSKTLYPGEFEDVTLACQDKFPKQVFVIVNQAIIAPPTQSDNLCLLPHTWAQTSGFSPFTGRIENENAFRGIDGQTTTRWFQHNPNFDPNPDSYEVRFHFPVNATSLSVLNQYTNTGFLETTLSFSNGFSMPFSLDSSGQGSITFPEQTGITWVRMTASATKTDGASLSEFIVGGSYIEPVFAVKEGGNGLLNNTASFDSADGYPPLITSVPTTATFVERPYLYQVEARDFDNEALTFSLDVFPAGMSIDASTGLVTWTPTSGQLGENPVTVRVTDASQLSDTQSFSLRVAVATIVPDVVSLPQADAESAIVAANLMVGTQTQASHDTVTLGHISAQNPLANTEVPAGSPVNLTVSLGRSPVANAGSDISAGEGELVTLDGSASFDPDGEAITFEWIPPSTVNLSDPNAAIATFTTPDVPAEAITGSTVLNFALRVSDGRSTSTDTVDVTVVDNINDPPVANAGPDRYVRWKTVVTLDGTASSDPNKNTITYSWTMVSMPVGSVAVLQNPTTSKPRFTPDVEGEYLFELVVTDNKLAKSAPDQVKITAANDTIKPTVSLTVNPYFAGLKADVTLTVTANDDKGIAVLQLTVYPITDPLDVELVALDQNGIGVFSSDTPGVFKAEVIAIDFGGNQANAGNSFNVGALSPMVEIQSPADGDTVTNITDIIGTVNDGDLASYTLSYAAVDDGNFIQIANGTSPVVNGVLGAFDPTLLQNDTYRLRLSATDATGMTSIIEQDILVAGELIVGNFKLSFTDLSIPVSGIPITITRTYDTLDAGKKNDMGFGWRLEMVDTKLQTSVKKTGLEDVLIFNPFRAAPSMYVVKGGTRVYVTIPGGKREGFTFRPKLAPGYKGSFLHVFLPDFVPDPGVRSKLTVNREFDLLVLDDPKVIGVSEDSELLGQVYLYGAPGMPYNPANPELGGGFTLMTEDGAVYSIDGLTGKAKSISDPNDNKLTFNKDGIFSSSGAKVLFERDAKGRISAVVDPMDNRILYGYDDNDNLVSVTDREGNVTQFVYNAPKPHYLTEIIDPLGRTGVRTEYDDTGRMVRMIDANGNPIEFQHNLSSNTETVVDRLGNPTTYVYDDRGNILTEVNALGGITQRIYDEDNNMLTKTDPLGNTTSFTYDGNGNMLTETDPLGNVTRYTYATIKPGGPTFRTLFYSEVATITNPLGNATANTYDMRGNLLSLSDSLGNVTTMAYDSFGHLTKIALPGGTTTTNIYDASGNIIRQTDTLGNETAFIYDTNGNRVTETTTQLTPTGPRTSTITTAYNAEGQVIAITDAEGNTTRFEYDKARNRIATVDALNRRTEFIYDEFRQLIETILPDATPNDPSDNPRTRTEYDAVGRKTSTIDEQNRQTKFEYDELGRLIKTILPDETPQDLTDNPRTQTEYDAAGRVVAQIDERGNRTEFEYDKAGRQTAIRDVLGNETILEYDKVGRTIAQTDPLGRITRFSYDTSGNMVSTTFADGSTINQVFGENRRIAAQTDQAGNTRHFKYTNFVQLSAVEDALSNRTEYAYTSQGNLVSQTDSGGRVTRFEYDSLGRKIATVLPLGQVSSTIYKSLENKTQVTDFNGNTITFEYDERNRIITKRFSDGNSVEFTYTPTGRIKTVTDARGVVRFFYDARDRLISRIDPDGTEISYTYDISGNRTSVTIPSGTTTYTYDALNRLETATDYSGGVTTYFYDAIGNLVQTSLPNGTVEKRQYDVLNRLVSLEHAERSGAIIASYAYTLDQAGNRIKVVENNGRQVDYIYDSLYRLIVEIITDATMGNRTIEYTYDTVGNRIMRDDSVEGITTYMYDDNDRLLSETTAGIVTNYTYDDNGNVISRITGAINRTFFEWDMENRLTGADTDGNGTINVEYQYDASGVRVGQIANSIETRFLIDASNPIANVLEEYAPDGSIQVSYVYGNRLISQNREGVQSFYHADGLGSTRGLTDKDGLLTDKYVFNAFGRTIAHLGTTDNVYLFAGEQRDNNVGLDYLRARYLDFSSGRFISRDPFAGLLQEPSSLHRYLYANANPVNFVDPSGEFFDLISTNAAMAVGQALAMITIPMVTTAALSTIIIVRVWEPAFEARYGALEILAATSDYDTTKEAFNVYNAANDIIATGAVFIELSRKTTDLGFAIASLVTAIVRLDPNQISFIDIQDIRNREVDIQSKIREINDPLVRNEPGAIKRKTHELKDFIHELFTHLIRIIQVFPRR